MGKDKKWSFSGGMRLTFRTSEFLCVIDANVGVSLRQGIAQSPLCGSLIPTYDLADEGYRERLCVVPLG